MANKLFILLVLLWLTDRLFSQDHVADSLYIAYQQEKDWAKKVDLYYELAYLRLQANPESGMVSADTLEWLAKKTKDKIGLSRAAYLRGMALTEQGKHFEALPYHQEELVLARQSSDRELLGRALNSLGNCFHNMGRNDSAIVYLVEAARVKEELGNSKDLAAAYANIGNVFTDAQAPEKAIEYLEKALAIRLSLPDGERSAIVTYNNLSVAYNGQGNYDKAIEYAQKGLDLADRSGQRFFAGVLAGSLGALWLKKENTDQSIEMSKRSVALLTELNRRSNLVYPYVNLAEAWLKKGDLEEALKYNRLGYALMEELKLGEPLGEYYENFAGIYEALDQPGEALSWYKRFVQFQDSLFNKDKVAAIAEVETRYETEKKEALLAKQHLDIERSADQRRIILLLAVAAILLLAGGFYLARKRQMIRQREAELAAKIEHAEAEKLRELDRLRSTFFANISHEFRTPLTLILSPVEQMLNDTFQGDLHKYLGIIHRNGRRLLDLVNQLLDLSKLENGKWDLNVSDGDLAKFIRAVAGSFDSLAVRRQVDYCLEIPEKSVIAWFDRDIVEKIAVNLISNAFKFTEEGGCVSVKLSQEDGMANVIVQDTGIGIPVDQLPHLFERFTKSTVSELQPGSGIGLALTKELTELHGGQLSVQSKEGEGSVFTASLAVSRAFFREEQIATKTRTAYEPVQSGSPASGPEIAKSIPYRPVFSLVQHQSQKPVLLIAEDNTDVRTYIAESLAPTFQILEAANGRLALEKAIDNTPDVIITDLMMPEMDGIELCRRIKTDERTNHIPVVMLTARADQSDILEGLDTGADDYLVKPFDARELQLRVRNLIESRKKLQDHYRSTLSAFTATPPAVESMDAVFLHKVRETVAANLDDENFSVVELSQKMALSRSQLHRKLSALTGYSPNEVIRNMRLERAKQLLAKKTATVSEVAFSCGFSSPAYFIKCYKDYFGVTPGQNH